MTNSNPAGVRSGAEYSALRFTLRLIFVKAERRLDCHCYRPVNWKQEKEDEMAVKDAEMPSQQVLSEDIQAIAKHLATLRKDIEALTGQIKRTGDHQLERAQDTAGEAL